MPVTLQVQLEVGSPLRLDSHGHGLLCTAVAAGTMAPGGVTSSGATRATALAPRTAGATRAVKSGLPRKSPPVPVPVPVPVPRARPARLSPHAPPALGPGRPPSAPRAPLASSLTLPPSSARLVMVAQASRRRRLQSVACAALAPSMCAALRYLEAATLRSRVTAPRSHVPLTQSRPVGRSAGPQRLEAATSPRRVTAPRSRAPLTLEPAL